MCTHKVERPNTAGPNQRVKLEFIAARLGVMPEVLSDRIEVNGRNKTLPLTPIEARNIRNAYEGQLPDTYEKVILVEGAEPRTLVGTPLTEPIFAVTNESPAEAPAPHRPAQEHASDQVAGSEAQGAETNPPSPKSPPHSPSEEALPPAGATTSGLSIFGRSHGQQLEPCLEPPTEERDSQSIGSQIHQLIVQLPNPAKRDDAKRQLIEIGQPAITRLIWGLEEPWKKEQCEEVLLAIAKKDRACLDTVTYYGVIALQNPKTVVSAREILTSLLEVDLGIVTNTCVRGLVSYYNPDQIKEIKRLLVLAARKNAPVVLGCCKTFFCRPHLSDHAEYMAFAIAQDSPKEAANFFVRQLPIPSVADFSKRMLCRIAEEIDLRAVLNPCSPALNDDAIKEHVKEILLFCAYLDLGLVIGRCTHIAAVDPQRRKNAMDVLVAISEKEPNRAISISIEIFEEKGQPDLLDELMPRIAERNLASVVERCLRELPNLQRHARFREILEKLAETRNAEIIKLVEQIRKTPKGAVLMERAKAAVTEMEAHS